MQCRDGSEKNRPSDGGGEVGVQGGSQAIVKVLRGFHLAGAKIDCLGHAPGGHDADELVEVGVLRPHSLVQRCCQRLHTRTDTVRAAYTL